MAASRTDARTLHAADPWGTAEARGWLWYVVGAGSVATLTYVVLIVLPGPDSLAVAVAFGFAASLSVGSVALWRLFHSAGEHSPLAMFAALSNALAGALFVAMVVVQVGVKSVQDPPDEALRSIYWGLDVAWDLYIGAGTLGFALVCWRVPVFRWLAAPGVLVAIAVMALNLATFPEPPSSAGLVDVGPLVGLWYSAVTVRSMFLLRPARAWPGIAAADPASRQAGPPWMP